MVIPNASTPHELRTAKGELLAVLISPDELARLQAEVESLREQVATLRQQRDRYAGRVEEMVRTWVPGPLTPEEIAEAERNPGDLSALIAEFERK